MPRFRWWWLPAAALLALPLLVLDTAPRVPPRADVAPADVDRALALLRQADPRRVPPGATLTTLLRERDLDLLLHHALHRLVPASARLSLAPGGARVQASLPLPRTGGHLWLNAEIELAQKGPLPEVAALRIGRLPLPAAWALPALQRAAAWRGVPTDALVVAGFVELVRLHKGYALLGVRLPADARERVLGALLPPAQRERVQAYGALLARQPEPEDGTVSLAALLPPLFSHAAERSAAPGADAAAENRAAIVALALYVNRRALDVLLPSAVDGLPAQPPRVTLAGREDFPRHFLVSAAIAADSGTPLADAVGLWKEMDDARRGSGFSFTDLAADRAGTRFGEMAVRDPQRLQARLGGTLAEADFMPTTDDLPEFLPERTFNARYGGVQGAAYRQLMAQVEARIDALPVWR